jgi:hypothetical protein
LRESLADPPPDRDLLRREAGPAMGEVGIVLSKRPSRLPRTAKDGCHLIPRPPATTNGNRSIDLPDGVSGTFTQDRFFYWLVSGNFLTRYYGWDTPDPFPGGGQATYTGNPTNQIGTSNPPTVPARGSLALAGAALAAAAAAARRRGGGALARS